MIIGVIDQRSVRLLEIHLINKMEYTQTGAYIAIAGLIVSGLSHFNIVVSQNEIVQIIAGLVVLVGIIKQAGSHRKLAIIAGAIKP